MALALTFIFMILAAMTTIQLSTIPKIDYVDRITGGYSRSSSSLKNNYTILRKSFNDSNESKAAARNANIAAIRLCRQLSYEMRLMYIAGDINCSNYNKSTVLYTFLGAAGSTGPIDVLYSAPMSSTLSCTSVDQYGRYIFSRALPKMLISGKNVTYNLIGVTDNQGDPCGFHEIVN